MIMVHLYYTGKGDAARHFSEEMESSGTADRIRSEEGNLRYSYFQPMDDPQTILLMDAWENQAALDRHHASEMMGEIARLREKYDLHMRMERFATGEDADIPADTDRHFLRE